MYAKEEKSLNAEGKPEAEKILLFKCLYQQSMQWEAMVIHNVVDDSDFEWKAGGWDEQSYHVSDQCDGVVTFMPYDIRKNNI